MVLKEAVEQEITRELSPKRLQHTRSTCQVCLSLAERFSLDAEAAWTASMWHDSSREWDIRRLTRYVQVHQLEITSLERRVPMLLHAPAAAFRLSQDLGCSSTEVYQAVRWHTTGHSSMGSLGYALYVADFLEPGRTHITGRDRERILSLDSLEAMMLEIYALQFAYFSGKDIEPEPESLRLYHKLSIRGDQDT